MESLPPTDPRAPTVAEDPALGLDRRAKFEILGAVLLALFLGALDQTIVGTALPRIVTDLGGNDLYTWAFTIYILTSTITVPFYGKLSDLYGRKPLLIGGIVLFLVGSALSGLSQNMEQLILFRGIQGLGAGSLFPISLAIIGDLFSPAERGKYQGLFGAVFGVSFILGPSLGGFLTDNISWHWVFYVNIPIGLVSLYVISRLLPNIKHPDVSRSLDFLGAAVFTGAIASLLIGLTNKVDQARFVVRDWTDPSVGGLILLGAVLTGVFLLIERRAKEPIVPLGMFRNRTFSLSLLATFFVSFAFFGAIVFLPRWFQVVRGESATTAGYLLFPLLVGLIGSSMSSGFLVARTGRYKPVILFGMVMMIIGIALMTQLRADTDYLPLFGWMFVAGIGIGPTMAVFTIAVQNAVPFRELGVATSNLTFFRQIGGSVGLAIAGTTFGTAFGENLVPSFVASGVPQPIAEGAAQMTQNGGGEALLNAGVDLTAQLASVLPPQLQAFAPNFAAGVYGAMSQAIASTFVIGIVAAVLALVATVLLPELPLRRTSGVQEAAATSTATERPRDGDGVTYRPNPALD